MHEELRFTAAAYDGPVREAYLIAWARAEEEIDARCRIWADEIDRDVEAWQERMWDLSAEAVGERVS
jgi:hypothetical protein